MILNSVLYGNNSIKLMHYGAGIFVLTTPQFTSD